MRTIVRFKGWTIENSQGESSAVNENQVPKRAN